MKKLKDWTVIIYMAGDNNLSDECLWAIKEMYRVGLQGDDIAVVTLFESKARGVSMLLYDMGNIPKLNAAIEAEAIFAVQTPVPVPRNYTFDGGLDTFGEGQPHVRRSVSARGLKRFILESIEKYPAKHYMVVLAGHGAGVVGQNFLKGGPAGRYLSIPRLRWALEQVNLVLANKPRGAKKLDILGLDACAMSMVEVAYEMRDAVNFMVGAEGFEINTGWPYHRILETLQGGGLKPAELARTIVEKYVTYYSDFAVAGVSVDQAACDLDSITPLINAIKELTQALTSKLIHKPAAGKKVARRTAAQMRENAALLDALILAHWRAQSYKFEEYVDLWDFCDLLQAGCADQDVQSACAKVKDAIGFAGPREEAIRDSDQARLGFSKPVGRCVLKSCFSGAVYQHSHGLSIYFPWVGVSKDYANMHFSKETGWHKFLQAYVNLTRREPRKGHGRLRPITASDDVGDEIRFGPPYDRFGPPYDRMGNTITPKMKNPPNGFYTDECVTPFME